MANIEEALKSYLVGNAGVSAIVSSRVFPFSVPQNAGYPAVTYQRISTPRIPTMDMSGASGTLTNQRFQIDAWADTYAVCQSLTNALRAALNGKTGSIGTPPEDTTVRAILVDNEVSEDNPEVGLYRMICDYVIWQEE